MTSPTPTPPCLGEREGVARTLALPHFNIPATYNLTLDEMRQTAVGGKSKAGLKNLLVQADAVIAEHIEPLRTENETLRAERDAAIARAEEMRERAAKVCDQRAAHCREAAHMATGVDQCERAARAIRALNLTTSEDPKP